MTEPRIAEDIGSLITPEQMNSLVRQSNQIFQDATARAGAYTDEDAPVAGQTSSLVAPMTWDMWNDVDWRPLYRVVDTEIINARINDITVIERTTGPQVVHFNVELYRPDPLAAGQELLPTAWEIKQVIRINYRTEDGSALEGQDYTGVIGTLRWQPGEGKAKRIAVTIRGDVAQENEESFRMQLFEPHNVKIGAGTDRTYGTCVITNATIPTVRVTGDTVSGTAISPATSPIAYVRILLSEAARDEIRMTWDLIPGTAVRGADYRGARIRGTTGAFTARGTAVFSPGETVKEYEIQIPPQPTPDVEKRFTFVISNVENDRATIVEATATIILEGQDLTPAFIVDDISRALYSAGEIARFRVRLSHASNVPYACSWVISENSQWRGGSAYAVSTTGNVTIPAGRTTADVNIAVTGFNFSNPSAAVTSDSGFDVTFQNGTPTSLGLPITTQVELFGPGATAPGAPTPVLSISPPTATVTEGNTTLDFTVALSAPYTQTVTVQARAFSGPNDTATENEDYRPTTQTMTFTPGQPLSQTFSVSILQDQTPESSESFTVELSGASPSEILVSPATALAIIRDDDLVVTRAGAIVDIATAARVREPSGASSTLRVPVRLRTAQTVETRVKVFTSTVNRTATAGVDFVNIPETNAQTLTFPAGNTLQYATVTILPDTIDEADETFDLLLSRNSADWVNVQQIGNFRCRARILQRAGGTRISLPQLSIAGATVAEGTASAPGRLRFVITLSRAPDQTAYVVATTRNGTAIAGRDYTFKSQVFTFAPDDPLTRNFDVQVIGDSVTEANELMSVVLSQEANAAVAVREATGIIANDDIPRAIPVYPTNLRAIFVRTGSNMIVTPLATSAVSYTLRARFLVGTTFGAWSSRSTIILQGFGTYAIPTGATSIQAEMFATSITGHTTGPGVFNFTIPGTDTTARPPPPEQPTAPPPEVPTPPAPGPDRPGVLPRISIGDVTVSETARTAILRLTASQQSTQIMSVLCSTRGGSALSGTDYYSKSERVTFPIGSVNASFQVTLRGDDTPENDETIGVVLSRPINCTIADSRGEITIRDDDQPETVARARVSVDDASYTRVFGRAGALQFIVRTTATAAPGGHQVQFNTSSGTARAGVDFTSVLNRVVRFTGTATTDRRTISVPVRSRDFRASTSDNCSRSFRCKRGYLHPTELYNPGWYCYWYAATG